MHICLLLSIALFALKIAFKEDFKSYDRDSMAHNERSICYVILYLKKKSLPTLKLGD